MRKLAVQLGMLGSVLGSLAGLIDLSIGEQIRPWIGNKENPAVLGLITLSLSGLAFMSIISARTQIKPSNDRKLAIILGVLLPAIICFTTVGRLWYLPGPLLLLASLLLAYEYWFSQSKVSSPKIISRKYRANQIIGWCGSILILASVGIAFSRRQFGLFQSEILAKAELIRIEILPMDFVRITKLSGIGTTVEEIEVVFVMIVFILLILGGAIALIASLTNPVFLHESVVLLFLSA